MVNKVRTLEFLPEIFRTNSNRQFLGASLDLLTSQPNLRRVQGFIGEKYGYGVEPTDKYVVEPTKQRSDYQLDPGVIFLKPDTQYPQDFINYSGILTALKGQGANVTNHNRLFENEFYSWDPFIDYDKIINYSQYYWIPNGPDAVPIYNTTVYDSENYTVTGDDNGYTFAEISGINPVITLLRGGTYEFDINTGFTPFWLQTVPGIDATSAQRTIPGVTNNGTTGGGVFFTVPDKATFVLDTIYYQSGSDPNSVGIINLIETNTYNPIDVDGIIGRKTYTSPNGVKFTNGLKIQFDDKVLPESYQNKFFYVDGVGTSIVLLPISDYIAAESTGEVIYNPWDYDAWDVEVWDQQLYVPVTPEYITVSRRSRDLNAWTRSNRWFHQDVLNTTQEALGYITLRKTNKITRAQRPIIEYRGNLKLYNSGVVGLGFINILDTTTLDAFSTIEGKTPAQVGKIDGLFLNDGTRIVFASDTNPAVRQNVYTVRMVPTTVPGVNIINLVPDTSVQVRNNAQVVVLWVEGVGQGGTTWWFNGTDSKWYPGQKKTTINQYPLYDIYDAAGHSLSDKNYYSSSSFAGTKLFSYTVGDGPDDPILGFPITYSSLESIGDILFTVNLNSDQFVYNIAEDEITENVNIGFVHHYQVEETFENLSGWTKAVGPSVQYQVFEFPIVKNYTYSTSNTTIYIDMPGTGYAIGDKLKISGDNLGGTTPENDLYFTVSAVSATGILEIDTTSFSGNSVAINDSFLEVDIISVESNGSSAKASVVISGIGTTTFKCDVLAKTTPDQTPWNPIVVYYNDSIMDENTYAIERDTINGTTSVTFQCDIDVKVTILLISDTPSKNAYYQTPSNLENNPFNTNVTSVAIGDLKNQFRTIFTNAPGIIGQAFGNNNTHDLGNLNNYGTAIIQNSASLVLPGLFLRKPEVNLFNSLSFNSSQYEIYKSLLIELAVSSNYSVYTPPSSILDDIIYQISVSKNQSTPFFWSDMIPSGNPYKTTTYTFNGDTTTSTFALSPDVWTDNMFSSANYRGISVYLTRVINSRSVQVQLIRDINYTVSTSPGVPSLTVQYDILAGDTITIKEYNQTYGSYCPSTPSKLGLYPLFIPAVVKPQNATDYYIRGHDGSYNKLYGEFTVDPTSGIISLTDFRDQILLEFEYRVYNNYKVTGIIPLVEDDVVPGQFRTTEYSREEVLDIYSTDFLNWVGANRLDYREQTYRANNEYTFNYNQTTNKLSGLAIQQGYWKGIYQWLYDTWNPATSPWEMLGLVNKPDWWDSRYGIAPYTSGNTYMWQEIADGYVWNNGDPYVNPARIRPGLLSALPVDSLGSLVSPFISIMGNYNSLTFQHDWIIGDGAPIENAYLCSSNWPFDLMRLLALTKPAKFFNLFADRDLYKYNDTLLTPGQYLYNDRYHLDPTTLQVYGNGTAKHSYINWIVEYNNQRGANGTDVVTTLLRNLDVRLVYNMAGFTAKNYLKFLIEKATPNSRNSSLLIPDENYTVLLYDNPPEERITYSSAIVQRVSNGWLVWGNSKNKNYFTTLVPKLGQFKKLTVRNSTVQVSQEFYNKTQSVPYGHVFYSTQAVAQFLQNYGAYLESQGVVFENISGGIAYDWTRATEEFLSWAQDGWEIGSVISLNPNARNFVVNRPGLVPQPLTIQGENFLLNENLLPIQSANMNITRENEKLEVSVLSPAETVAFGQINLSSIEHAIIFDNYTSFNDTIYNLTTGLRQSRLLLQGYKTGDWTGYINTSGFILNENNVKDWEPNVKYPKNFIVIFKNKYYAARKLIEPSMEFVQADWIETDYDQIKSGLLPNPSTTAYESLWYYDTTRANLENDADLLSFSLIGFRPREYMAAADLSDITQINVYKNIIKEKGTKLLADSFRGAELGQGAIDYIIQENWAIRGGDFGSVLNNNFVEARLNQPQLTGNPTLVGFAQPGTTVPDVQQSIPINELINWERPPLTAYFLPPKQGSYSVETGIPTAGYVNLGDSKFQKYTFEELNEDVQILATLYRGDNIWIANHKSSWDIYTTATLNNQLIEIQNNLNGTITATFDNVHNLSVDDLICIIGFDARVNGFYSVKSIYSIYSIILTLDLDSGTKKISSSGTGFKLVSRRFEQPSSAANSVILYTEWSTRKIWADYGAGGQWEVWAAGTAYKEKSTTQETGKYGSSVASSSVHGDLVVDGDGNLYRYYISGVQTITNSGKGTGTTVKIGGAYVFCSSPDDNKIFVYSLDTTTDLLTLYATINPLPSIGDVTGAIATSADGSWLYVGDATNQKIAVYNYSNITYQWVYVTTLVGTGAPAGSGWATSLATSTDGVKLIVGAPYETVDSLQEAGSVYVYTRRVQRFYADGVTTNYTLANATPNNIANVYVNDVLLAGTASIVGTNLSVFVTDPNDPLALIPPPLGSIITASTGYIEFVQKFTSDNPHFRGWYGINVDTNRYGADFVVGAPYEASTVDNVQGVEGAVYKYTNGGQRYGVISTTITGSLSGTIFVDGYIVVYNGDINSIRDAINTQTPTNIIAAVSGSTLTITVKEQTPEVIYNIIDITGSATALTALGIKCWTKTQVIKNHNLTTTSGFGYNVKMNERDGLLITALDDIYVSPTTFDYTTDCVENDTILDNDSTIFVDRFTEQGVVYLYDYLPAYNEGITNPGQYAFGQYINTNEITPGTPAPKFGYGLSYTSGKIIVGAPSWSTSGGGIAVYDTNWTPSISCEPVHPNPWYVDKQPLPVVDIDAINNICIYNSTNNVTLEYLDYIDPVQGKLLGALATNIDILDTVDPAVYTLGGVSWTWDHVGDTWLDLSTIRMLNYHQPDVAYNSKNWGKAFPGSTADIYTWIESTQSPIEYSGSGFPLSFDRYNTVTSMDNSTNSLVTTYYFWVKNYDVIPKGKTLSPLICSTYLLNPLNSGIGFLAPITTNIVGLYNSGEYIQANTSVLHLGYGLVKGMDDKHTSWSLIRDGDPEDFLSGLPSILGNQPSGLYLKFLESFSGFDANNNPVPDPRLPALIRYGTSFRPRQSMFIDRLLALKNYIVYANNILIKLPITEIRNLNLLQTHGSSYDTRNYWKYVNWWSEGYSDETKPVLAVANVNDLQVITENQLLTSIAGTNILLEDGLIAKVQSNTYGNSEYYVYSSTSTNKWTRIGAENTTIQILPSIWGLYGWASEPWGGIWDKNPSQEIVYVIRWLNEQCYIDDLGIEKNRSLVLMFKFIQSESLQENNYLPWLNKTSLIDVNHRIRSLLPYKKYQRDNQEFLEGFINEVKPYHVLIKDFVFSYNGEDTYAGNLTDFDLPAQYNYNTSSFQTPQLVYGTPVGDDEFNPDSIVWDNVNYKEWYGNTGLQINNTELGLTPVTTLAENITQLSLTLKVKNSYGLPVIGTIRIGSEDISYDGIDLATDTLYGLTRGVNTTTATPHNAGSEVYLDVPAVIVYNTGRGYTEPPKISAWIDTSVYPAPRVEATFTPIMAADRLIGITVNNPGSGYAVEPVIMIPGSSITATVSYTSFNLVTNTVTVAAHAFQTGDPVIYSCGAGSTPPTGLQSDTYYYVRVIDANTISLYETYEDATMPSVSPYLHVSTSDGRVDLLTSGTGSNHTFAVTARASCATTGRPVREFKIKIKFDRVSYTLEEGVGTAVGRIEEFYTPTLTMPGKDLPQLMTGVQYPNATLLSQDFRDKWDWTNFDIYPWDGILDNPPIEVDVTAPAFTSTTPTVYDIADDEFLEGYTPEELVGQYVSDHLSITITSNDISPSWNHTIKIDQYGNFNVFNNSGVEGYNFWLNRWWYGTAYSNPTTDPLANTPLSTNTNPYAVFLRS